MLNLDQKGLVQFLEMIISGKSSAEFLTRFNFSPKDITSLKTQLGISNESDAQNVLNDLLTNLKESKTNERRLEFQRRDADAKKRFEALQRGEVNLDVNVIKSKLSREEMEKNLATIQRRRKNRILLTPDFNIDRFINDAGHGITFVQEKYGLDKNQIGQLYGALGLNA